MSITEQAAQAEYTEDQVQAYERYISAIAEHNIVCARRAATTRDKMDAAFVIERRYQAFCEAAGFQHGTVRSPKDVQRIAELDRLVTDMTEVIRSAHAMLYGADNLDVLAHVVNDGRDQDRAVVDVLMQDAMVVLRACLDKAEAE